MTTPIETVTQALQAKGSRRGQKIAGGYNWQCSAHEDRTPSLSVSETPDGNVLLKCHAGCDTDDVVAKLDLTMSDLFVPDLTKTAKPRYAKRQLVATYPYRDGVGELVYQILKYDDKSFQQQKHLGNGEYAFTLEGTETVLYNLPRVLGAIAKDQPIWLTEGEKDAETVMLTGRMATCNPTGADSGTGGKFTESMFASLKGAKQINILIDNDAAGITHGKYVFNRLKDSGTTVNIYRPTVGNDITEHLASGATFETIALLDSTKAPTGWADIATLPDLEPDSGWLPQDLALILSGDFKPAVPSILTTTNGKALFYPGKVNALWGPSDSGKTTVLMLAMAQEITAGNHVGYLDFEDKAERFIEMLQMQGISEAQIVEYAHYVNPPMSGTPQEIENLVKIFEDLHCTLVGIDSVGEALALDSINQNDDGPVATWHRDLPRKLSAHGIGVALVDHVPKGKDDDGYDPIGSQRKKAAINGVAYKVKAVEAFSKEKSGKIRINVAKDRCGTYAKRSTVAVAAVTVEDGFSIILYDPQDATPNQQENLRDDRLIELISDWIWTERDQIFSGAICLEHIETLKLEAPHLTTRQVRDAVRVLQGVAYSTPEGRQFRLQKRYYAQPVRADLNTTSTEVPGTDLNTSTDLNTRSTPTSTRPQRSQGDQSELTSTRFPSPLREPVVELSDDTTSSFFKSLPDDFKRFTQ